MSVRARSDRRFDLGALERREREHRATPNRGSVARRGEHGREMPRITDRSERGDRGLAHERIGVLGGRARERARRKRSAIAIVA